MTFESPSAKRQIRNLLAVFISGIACAFLLSVFLVYNYGPSGKYIVRNALISPDLVTILSYNDTNVHTGGMSRFVYNGLEFSYYDSKAKQQKIIQLDPDQYNKLYQSIISDSSILEAPSDVTALFSKDPAALAIKVRTESHAPWQDETKDFQRVEFVNDFYRIKLHEEKSADQWVYFKHPGIYQEVLNIISPP